MKRFAFVFAAFFAVVTFLASTQFAAPVLAEESKDIHVLMVVDTDKLLAKGLSGSEDQEHPQNVNHPDVTYLFSTDSTAEPGTQGKYDLMLDADLEDNVIFSGMSASGNSRDIVIVYGLSNLGKEYPSYFPGCTDTVLERLGPEVLSRPNEYVPSIPNILPPAKANTKFVTYAGTVDMEGCEAYALDFAFYKLKTDNKTYDFKGYYRWEPKIKVE